MTAKLTPEMRSEIAANPHQAVPIVDEESGKVYYVVDEDFLAGPRPDDKESRARLKTLLQQGFSSPAIPEEEAEIRIQAKLADIATKLR